MILILIAISMTSCAVGYGFAKWVASSSKPSAGPSSDTPASDSPAPELDELLEIRILDQPVGDSQLDFECKEAKLTPAQLYSVLSQVQSLTDSVRGDVHVHSSEVEKISDDLSATPAQRGVKEVIARLIEANRHLDDRLQSAEEELKSQSELLMSQRSEARTDPLTGLPNRRSLDEEFDQLSSTTMATKDNASLIMIDIDHFKNFNDEFGHPAGDACLKRVSAALKHAFAGLQSIVTRYGGEEFVVLLPKASLLDAKAAALHAKAQIEELDINVAGSVHNITVSQGVASNLSKESFDSWLQRADEALYLAKRRGRNRAAYHDGNLIQLISTKQVQAEKTKARAVVSQSTLREIDREIDARFGSVSPKREEFLNQAEKHLLAFRRAKTPVTLMLLSLDPFDELPAHRELEFDLYITMVEKLLRAAAQDFNCVEFVSDNLIGALFPETETEGVLKISERIHQAVSRLNEDGTFAPNLVTVSFGVAVPAKGDEADHLLARAQKALITSQSLGGNCTHLLENDLDWNHPQRVEAASATHA